MTRMLALASFTFAMAIFAAPALADPQITDFRKSPIPAKSAEEGSDERLMVEKADVIFPLTIIERDVGKKLLQVRVKDKPWWVRETDIVAPGLDREETKVCLAGETKVAPDKQLGATQMGMGEGRCAPK